MQTTEKSYVNYFARYIAGLMLFHT